MSVPRAIVARAVKLRGKALPVIQDELSDLSREDLVALVSYLAVLEPSIRPSEVAAALRMRKRDVLVDVKAGKFGDYFSRGANSILLSASGVNAYR